MDEFGPDLISNLVLCTGVQDNGEHLQQTVHVWVQRSTVDAEEVEVKDPAPERGQSADDNDLGMLDEDMGSWQPDDGWNDAHAGQTAHAEATASSASETPMRVRPHIYFCIALEYTSLTTG